MSAAMTALAQAFPCMANAAHVRPQDASGYDRWATETPLSHCEVVSGRFDLMDAMSMWEMWHRTAILAWANDPWWP